MILNKAEGNIWWLKWTTHQTAPVVDGICGNYHK